MTHTLHRLGTSTNLRNDYVIFAMSAKGINERGSAAKLRRFMEIALAYNPINAGDMKTGNILSHKRETILERIQDVSIVHAVFDDEESVSAVLREVKKADLGISVVISGLMDGVERCAKATGTRRHTVEWSLGIWGRRGLLPSQQVLEIETMCGHGMVAASLVERMALEVRRGRMSAEDAALQLARPCVCGVFNPVRTALLLRSMAGLPEAKAMATSGS
jgi:hypothetical protein